MKRIFIGICCVFLCFSLVACSNHLSIIQSSRYSNFTAKGEDGKYEISGRSQVVNSLHLLYISALEDTSVDLSGELKSISGDVQIVYINPDNKETVISDSTNDSRKGKLKLDTSIKLDKGKSRLEFRGKDTSFKFDLLFAHIAQDKFEYFSAEEEEEYDEESFEGDNIEYSDSKGEKIRNEGKDKLLKKVSVTYTDKDDKCTVLNTSLSEDTNIKVLVEANVSNIDHKDNLCFGGFRLTYKTKDGEKVEVLKHKTNEFAMGGYAWQDSFVQEIELPKGTNKLIFNSYQGKNYKITLNIQLFQVD
ncbi:hypothetical protein SAMN02745136_01048 [Anaerocolumna jejuensis DSM 15929]|uniref:Uncharacterized protein n=1 Tax=Anaerocolumna jejuensis DSM 15929 TaxID=1121322 RepID=A0A1M6MJY6_9FIRM|nr:hypothetical protein SAMN02745136_01048 [Anaerocolumna jejuensis DSM 15929]